ncbi:MAG TPA: pilus assembly protein PilM [Candidatus Eisenbacteria bacterium]|nr:pilus assembly protein PilM [Candidatus Eisenbacteria bacterium]
MRPIVFGIDISDRSIEIVSLLQKKDTLVVDRAGRREIPAGLIERGVIQDADALVKTLAGFFDVLFGPKRGKLMAGAMLPATTVYSKTFTMPAGLDLDMLRKAVAIEAADVFPIPMSDAVDAMILAPRTEAAEGPQDVLYAVAQKEAVKAYRNVLVRAGAQPLFLDSEDQALARGLGASRPAEPILVVDIGNRSTLLVLTDRSGMRMSASIPFGGAKLLAALEKKLKVTLQEGDKLLRTQGFDPAAGDSRTFFILQQPTEELIAEIRKTLAYVEKRYGAKVRGIILAGGISLSPGLVEYVGSNFQGLAVGLGKPFYGIDAGQTDADDKSRAVLYAAAYGLALRAMNPRGSPGMDFTPGKPESKSPLASAGKFFSSIFSPLSMVTKGKKSHPRKKKEAAEEPVLPAVPADLPPVEAPEEQPSTETSAVEELPAAPPPAVPVSVMDMTPAEMVPPPKEPPKPAVVEPAEEPDFGLGIGDILRGEDEIKTPKVDLDAQPSAPADDTGKLSIEDILNRGAAPPEKKKAIVPPTRPAARKPAGPPIALPPGTGKAIALVLLVLFLFGVAAAGIYMFVKKNGMPKLPFGQQAANQNAAPAPAPATEPPAAAPGEAPTSVSLTAVIGTSQKASTPEKPFLLSRIIETDVKATETFTSTGTTKVAAGKSCGTATIINTTARTYTFVATTRLLSKEGVLFRMTSAANIPASGTVDVHVCADQPGPEGDIGPTTFTIPGLSPEQQKRITAKSTAPMTGGSGTAKAVTAADIAGARQKLMDKLKKEALDNFSAMLADGEKLNTDLMTSKELSATFPTAGTAGATFTATLSLRYRVLLIPEKDLAPHLAAALTASLPSGMSTADFSLGAPLYTVQAYDTGAETAEVRVEAPVIKR